MKKVKEKVKEKVNAGGKQFQSAGVDAGEADNAVPLVITKLHRPQLPASYQRRQRLLDELEGNRELPLVLIAAPAGYGKSALVAEWTAVKDHPAAWVCLDDSDNDLRVFVRYVVAAVESMFPESCPLTSSVIEVPELPSVRVLAGQLGNELDAIGEAFTLVLDDYHEIKESAIHDFLSEILRHPPLNVQWLITTRLDPPLPLASLRARNLLGEVRFDDLQFSATETAQLMVEIIGHPLSAATLSRVVKMTEGWVAGMQLVGVASRHQADPEAFLCGLRGNIREVQDYLISEVLSRETPEFRKCILKTALVDRFSTSFCKAVCEGCDNCALAGEGMMGKLADTGTFMIPLDAEGEWFRYHQLFRDLLRWKLKQDLDEEELAKMHIRASRWFEGLGSIEEAITHALQAGDPEAAAAIVERHRQKEFDKDRWHVVARWLGLVPKELVWSRPQLLISKGMVAYSRFQLERVPDIVDRVEELIEGQPEDLKLRAEMGFLQGNLEYWTGEAESARQHFEEVLLLAENLSFILGETELILGLARCMCGEQKAAIKALEKRVEQSDPSESYFYSRLVGGLVFIHLVTGNLSRARAEAEHLKQLAKKNKIRNTEAWSSYFLGCSHLHACDLEAAVEAFSEAAAQGYVMEPRAFFDNTAGLALAQQLLGRSEQATKTLETMAAFGRELNDRQHLSLVHSCRARVALLRGDLKVAKESASLIDEVPSPAGLFMWLSCPPITKARVLIAGGSSAELEQAAELLHAIRSQAEACRFTCQEIETTVLEAVVLEKRGRGDEALAAIKSVLILAEPGGFIRPFVEAGETVGVLLKREGSNHSPFHDEILNQLQKSKGAGDDRVAAPKQPLIEPLTNRELDVLELIGKRLYDKEIADRLCISPGTVKSHLKHIYQKLLVGNRRQAVDKATELGML